MSKRTTFLDRVMDAARLHGEQSEAEHEIGDLQAIAWALWSHLTPKQRKEFAAREDMNDLIVWWNDAIAGGS